MTEVVNSQLKYQTFNEKIRALKLRGCNIIGNEVHFEDAAPLGFKYAIEIVNINPDPKFQQVYPQKGGGSSLTAHGLKIIAKAMNVRSLPGEIVNQSDEKICYRARAYILGLDGQPVTSEKDYEFSLVVREDEFLEKYSEKSRIYQDPQCPPNQIPPAFQLALKEGRVAAWVKEQARVEMIQTRKTAYTKAQTGAQLRCIRDLGPIQSTYTADQLKMPFLIVKLVQFLDPNNPIDRQFALEQSRVPMMMFPQQSEGARSLQQLTIEAQSPAATKAPALRLPEQEEASQINELVDPLIDSDEEDLPLAQSQASPVESAMMDFDACETPEQIATIQTLMQSKAWKGNLRRTVKEFSAQERRQFFQMLVTLPKPDQSSLPWS